MAIKSYDLLPVVPRQEPGVWPPHAASTFMYSDTFTRNQRWGEAPTSAVIMLMTIARHLWFLPSISELRDKRQ